MNYSEINKSIQARADQMVSKGQAKHSTKLAHRQYLQRQSKAFNESIVKSKIQKVTLESGAPDFLSYLMAYTDLPVEAVDQLMDIVEKSPTQLAFDTFCKQWNLV